MSHLRFAGASAQIQRQALCDIARASPGLWNALRVLRDLDLPQGWIVSGAIYNQVWNHLTGRPDLYGVKDIDVFYFDPDTSWEAEDKVIARVIAALPGPPPAEARNQARVHLWYERRFGSAIRPYRDALEPVANFASLTHSVGLRLDASDTLHVHTPYGLDDVFRFRVAPNPRVDNRDTHESKGARHLALWPELSLVPWPETPVFRMQT